MQVESKKAYPPDAMDDVDEFQAKLIGSGEDAAPQIPLLRKLLTQITDGVLNTRVKVGLLQCFTMSIDKHRLRTRLGEDHKAALKNAQVQMADAGATQMVAIMVQDTDREVCGRGGERACGTRTDHSLFIGKSEALVFFVFRLVRLTSGSTPPPPTTITTQAGGCLGVWVGGWAGGGGGLPFCPPVTVSRGLLRRPPPLDAPPPPPPTQL